MPDIKNYDNNKTEKDLKHADAERAGGTISQIAGMNLPKNKKGEISGFSSKQTARKSLPIVVDIIVALLILAIFAGVVVGAYFVFRAFAVDFESIDVEYTVLVPCADGEAYSGLEYQSLYYDVDGSVEFFGKVKSVQMSEKGGAVLMTVSATVRYKEGEGYSVGDVKLAVGQEYTLRSESGRVISGTVVELHSSKQPKSLANTVPVTVMALSAKGGR